MDAGNLQNKLPRRIEAYRLYLMRFRSKALRATVATGISLWIAVVACLIGCTLPSFANFGSVNAPSIHENSTEQNQPDLMANMENCPYHSGRNAPPKQNDRKPVPGGRMSCCPVEVTVASKPDTATLHIVAARQFVLKSDFGLMTVRFFHSPEFVPLFGPSGRDTLLETQLLRI
jgi:hypothetical protein